MRAVHSCVGRRGALATLPWGGVAPWVQMRRLPHKSLLPAEWRSLAVGTPGGRGIWGILDAVQGKKMIGKDRSGNTYWEVANPGRKPDPIREVDYVEKQMVSFRPDPPLACLLLSWLHTLRVLRGALPSLTLSKYGSCARHKRRRRSSGTMYHPNGGCGCDMLGIRRPQRRRS